MGRITMINTILFDLDGTILPMDIDKFMYTYFNEMGVMFKDLIPQDKLIKYIMECTELMVKNIDNVSNKEVFVGRFEQLIGGDINDYLNRFDEFYDTLFQNVQTATGRNELIIKSVLLLKEKGYQIVLATNPLFPMKANHHRIRWAGLSPEDFSYISCYETNKYCKPNIEYYQEVLDEIDKSPKECMMVGNDAVEDMAAGKLGLKTYLISEHMINKNNIEVVADYIGDYNEFYNFVKSLIKL